MNFTTAPETELMNLLVIAIQQYESAIGAREAQVSGWRAATENRILFKGNPLFKGASQATTPLTATLVDTMKGQICGPVYASLPMVMMQPEPGGDPDAVSQQERFLENRLVTRGFRARLSELVGQCLADGAVYLELDWDEEANDIRFEVVSATDIGGYPISAPGCSDQYVYWKRERIWPVEMERRIETRGYDAAAVKACLASANQGYKSLLDNEVDILDGYTVDADPRHGPRYVYNVTILRREGERTILKEMVVEPHSRQTLVPIKDFRFQHGRVPYHRLSLLRRVDAKKHRYGMSAAELLANQQKQADGQRRQKFDIANMAMGTVTMVKKAAKSLLDSIFPGSVVETSNPETDIKTVSLRPPGAEVSPVDEQMIKQEARELLGISESNIGQSTDTPLGVVQAAQMGTATRLDDAFTALEEFMREVVLQIFALYLQFDPGAGLTPDAKDQLNFQVQQNASLMPLAEGLQMSAEILSSPSRVSMAVASRSTNPVVAMQRAEKKLMFSRSSPVISGDPGLVYDAEREYLIDMRHPAPERALGAKEAFVERASAPKDQEAPKISLSGRVDELGALAIAIGEGRITPEQYMQVVELAVKAAEMMPARDTSLRPGELADNPVGPGPATFSSSEAEVPLEMPALPSSVADAAMPLEPDPLDVLEQELQVPDDVKIGMSNE